MQTTRLGRFKECIETLLFALKLKYLVHYARHKLIGCLVCPIHFVLYRKKTKLLFSHLTPSFLLTNNI